ncbi:arginine ABC transporter ATP-binding protein [Photobacterium iliopiscarium]|jgi:arginine transport system ATP-binding protein|uniref:Arginine transport ATP-binding protein ArtP n=1 Tax=Photobacterium iliopiscarium TaxID=56192 RepID=A0A0D8PUB5_9GAMM|nr:arginine ABC transporter ATP-binding protein ArtP [Photobacterium iliopiscarium]KJG22521.1 arginine ABC transporter ATP-binding protein [Photobacterium iliopiscarium]PST91443.1 arginine ABC transporter ATP-binding protein ArtP [Photobacterium iliopiscarium]PSU00637.1 arginine ABC transporter ATP-binding protein ArtP [Photobacterium iliopiscarium]PSV82323.1 arginine ABC transporter ATP-binding protein ArtP [Photobacterium iliopiscarium]PSV98142.1 arginine ABC transporter ATP-binding protein 
MSIQVSNINKFYGPNQVLHDVSFTCNTGETLVLLGPSGAGKSSLLRVLNLLENATDGKLTIANDLFDFSKPISEQKGLALRKKVGMVFQQYNLWPHKTVIENLIEAPTKVLGINKAVAKQQALDILTQLHLADKANAWPLQLSGGQQQRVAIARALMMKPDVLLFDEPTAALDPEITSQIVKIIKDLSGTGITQVVVTHEVDFAKKIASHILYMENGRVIEHGNHGAFTAPQTTQFAEYLNH